METNMSTTIEESVRKLRGIRYILSSLSYQDDLDPGQTDMYELLARTIFIFSCLVIMSFSRWEEFTS